MKDKMKGLPPPTGPPRACYRSPSGIHYLPKVQKDKDGKWQISSPYLKELLTRKNTGDSGEER